MNRAKIIELKNISKKYVTGEVETVALAHVSFTISRGEFVAIMGPSGSGKSTLMHIMGCLDKPTEGVYMLDGENVSEMEGDELAGVRNRKIGFIFQAFNLLPRISALKNVMLPMMYAGVKENLRLEKAREYLEMVGLGDRMEHTSSQLSGGQQQRVAIARGLVMNPAILLADEPTGNIASNQAAEIMDVFSGLHRKGHTIVMITHEPDIAEYAGRVITVKDGRIIGDKQNGRKRKNGGTAHEG